jgi:hypothetical protein
MGHTHRPFMQSISDMSTYVNLGHWAIDQLDQRTHKPPCSHLVIRRDDAGRAAATLYSWDRKRGASLLRSDTVQDTAEEASTAPGREILAGAATPPNLS